MVILGDQLLLLYSTVQINVVVCLLLLLLSRRRQEGSNMKDLKNLWPLNLDYILKRSLITRALLVIKKA